LLAGLASNTRGATTVVFASSTMSSRPAKKPRTDNPARLYTNPILGSVYFSGNSNAHPQAAMLTDADDKGHDFFVVRQDNKGRSFASYKDSSAFLEQYIKMSRPACFEIIRGHCRFYLDVEWEVPLSERDDATARARLDLALACCADVLNTLLLASQRAPINKTDWIVLVGSRPVSTGTWKHSYHANLKSVHFANNHVVLGAVMAEVRRRVEAAGDDRLFWRKDDTGPRQPIIDFCVYTKNRAWRLPLSLKPGGDPTPLTFEAAGIALDDAFVTVRPTNAVLSEADVARVWPLPAEKKTRVGGRAPLAPATGIMAELTKMIRLRGDKTSIVVGELPRGQTTRRFACRTVGVRVCPWQLEHDSNNFYLVVSGNGDVWYHCHKSYKRCWGKSMKIGHVSATIDSRLSASSVADAAVPMASKTTPRSPPTSGDEMNLCEEGNLAHDTRELCDAPGGKVTMSQEVENNAGQYSFVSDNDEQDGNELGTHGRQDGEVGEEAEPNDDRQDVCRDCECGETNDGGQGDEQGAHGEDGTASDNYDDGAESDDDFEIDTDGLKVERYNEPFVRQFGAAIRVECVKSAMGSGKTTALRKILTATGDPQEPRAWQLARRPLLYKRVVVVTPRIQFARTVYGNSKSSDLCCTTRWMTSLSTTASSFSTSRCTRCIPAVGGHATTWWCSTRSRAF
jgi:hypothetical protein